MAKDKYKVTIKTPVHIGSGEKFSLIDSMSDGKQYLIIDIEKVLDKLKDNPEALNDFGEYKGTYKFNIKNFLRDYEINSNSVKKYVLNNPYRLWPGNISEMVKTGFGNPMIPGTSFKGALRTVVFWCLFKDLPVEKVEGNLNNILQRVDPNKSGSADDLLDLYFFGKDPNHDLLRSLQVGDAEFKTSDMELIDTKVLTTINKGSFSWKKMGKDGFNTPDPLKATPIYCEALSVGTTSTVNIKLDRYLLEDTIAGKQLGFSIKGKYLTDLAKYCNEFSRNFISEEIKFFNACNMQEIVKFYTDLQEKTPQDKKSFLLHLGWGSGWRGMTGNYLKEEWLNKFREKFNLGKIIYKEILCPTCKERTKSDKFKKGFNYCFNCRKSFPAKDSKTLYPIFPKTRKIVFENGRPKYPLGWVKVEVI